jgi:hypothetical protein
MTRLIVIILLNLTLISCEQANIKNNKAKSASTKVSVDISSIAILPYDTTLFWICKDCKPLELTEIDLEHIEKLLIKCINNYNPEQEKRFQEMNSKFDDYELDKNNFIIDLKKYKRQYIAVINSRGEKEVWINCFCDTSPKGWKNNLIIVEDGGNCYFNLKINLTTDEYYDLMVNGVA